MNHKMFAVVTAALLMFATAPVTIAADDAKDDATATVKTVFVSGKGQSSFADKVNATHAEMTAKGWKFADLDIYVEDGDMQGAFVSYTR
jgi:hypothetical protein